MACCKLYNRHHMTLNLGKSFEGREYPEDLSGPFDPNSIDVDISTVNLGSLLEQLEYGEIDLQPEFQRSSDVWSPKQKSRLIESALLGLPLPSFYFSEDPNTGKLIIVDGLQRLCAFKDFWVEKKLVLQGLQFLKYLEGYKYDDLDRNEIRRIKGLKVSINILRKSTPIDVKYVIFQRVNSAGIPLNPQEMRNALYQGSATKLLRKLADSDSFKRATNNKIKPKRMDDCDLVNRFIAFYVGEDYKGNLDTHMCEALDKVNHMGDDEINGVYKAFESSMEVCYEVFKNRAFKRPNPNMEGRFLKLNKAIFETLSVSIAKLPKRERDVLIEKKEVFLKKTLDLFKEYEFINSVTSGTAKVEKVKYRYNQINNLIRGVVGYDH